MKIDPHFNSVFAASFAAADIIDLLPDTDLIAELRNLIYSQKEIIQHLLVNKHYGIDNLIDFYEYTIEVQEQIKRLKDAS